MNKKKIIGIEFLRFLSMTSILIYHFQHFAHTFEKNSQPFYKFLSIFYDHGYLGVQVFWCISGVVFFYKYLDKILEKKIMFVNFLKLRFSRLYPLHFATLIIVLILQLIYENLNGSFFVYIFDIKHFILNLFLINGWGLEDQFSFNGPTWSVSIEIIIYIIFFITFFYLRIYVGFLFSIILFILIYFVSLADGNIAYALFYFFIGGLISISKYSAHKIFSNNLLKKYFFYILGIFISLAIIFIFNNNFLYKKFFLPITTISLVYFFVLTNQIFTQHEKFWSLLGNLTYGSYLIHFPVQLSLMIIFKIFNIEINIESTSLFLFYIMTTFIISFFVYKNYELPAQGYIRSKYIK